VRPVLRVITPGASPEETAAIVAAIAASTAAATPPEADAPPSQWVAATRLSNRRAGLRRGEWRLSGRLGRRART
jgi:hypothetical protein